MFYIVYNKHFLLFFFTIYVYFFLFGGHIMIILLSLVLREFDKLVPIF